MPSIDEIVTSLKEKKTSQTVSTSFEALEFDSDLTFTVEE
jgi:hypothetical protein